MNFVFRHQKMMQQDGRSFGRFVDALYGSAKFVIPGGIVVVRGSGGFTPTFHPSHKFIRVEVSSNR